MSFFSFCFLGIDIYLTDDERNWNALHWVASGLLSFEERIEGEKEKEDEKKFDYLFIFFFFFFFFLFF